MAKKKITKNKIKVVTPPGILSYPQLAEPDTGRQYSDDKYHTDFFISPEDWKRHPDAKKLREAVLKVGRKHAGDDSLELDDFANPFRDVDSLGKKVHTSLKGSILIRPKSVYAPTMVGANKEERLTEAQVRAIKGGDKARLVVVVYPYTTKSGEAGVTTGLNAVQFIKSGPSLGGGAESTIAMLDDIEIEPDDLDVDEDDTEEETPKAVVKKKAKAAVEEEVEADFAEDDEEEEAPKKKAGRPKGSTKKKVEEDDDQEPFDFDDSSEE